MTSKEFKALKTELTRKAHIIVIQRRPWCTVVAEVEHNGQCYIDFGHSKANWPDWYSTKRGKEIALGRAINEIAIRIECVEATTPTDEEFYVDFAPGLTIPAFVPPAEDELSWMAYLSTRDAISVTGSDYELNKAMTKPLMDKILGKPTNEAKLAFRTSLDGS
ncbi:hypothetical protein MUP59_08270 [Candidatus Bathyarchaeota archaeon]|nr:hypothetical protein [Candidatus Bathyarchaeota archaeon]